MANATEDNTVSPGGDATFTADNHGTPNGVHPNRRRIIKASYPKGPKGTNGDTYSHPSNGITNEAEDEEDADHVSNNHHLKKKKQEDDDEDPTEGWRNERMKATEKRGKALREKDLQERRKTNVVNESANAMPNPFSRFLSAFSVEPKFPEHKRSYEGEEDDNSVVPSGKRLRPSDSCGPQDDDGNSTKKSSSGLSWVKSAWVATALAVVVGLAMAVHRGRKK